HSCRDDSFFYSSFSALLPPETYPLSLHDALPIWAGAGEILLSREWAGAGGSERERAWGSVRRGPAGGLPVGRDAAHTGRPPPRLDRKSTRLNSSHVKISYAVFCLKQKKNKTE